MIELHHVPEPLLEFKHGQSLEDPRDGLTLFGPLDEGKPYGIRPAVIGTIAGIEAFKDWLRRIQSPIFPRPAERSRPSFPGFEAAFRTPVLSAPLAEIEIPEDELNASLYLRDAHQRVFNTVDLFSSRIIQYHLSQETLPDLWFVVIPEEVYLYCRPKSLIEKGKAIESGDSLPVGYARRLRRQPSLFPSDNIAAIPYHYDINFHHQLKARLIPHKIPTQILRENTIAPRFGEQPAFRRLSSPEALQAQVAWNICSAAFYKAGGRPWKIASVREGVCYIGLAFRIDEKGADARSSSCGAQMFLDSGDGIVFRGALGPWHNPQRGDFHLSREAARDLISVALAEYISKWGRPPSELFIHGKVWFNNEEWLGFSSAAPEGTKLIGVRIRDDKDLKLYRRGEHPVLRGLAYVRDNSTAYLWTRGFIPRLGTYPGKEVPRPLRIDVCRGEAHIETVLRDIMALTKLNYNACIFSDGNPVTLSFADAVGEILTAGPSEGIPPLPFLYYI